MKRMLAKILVLCLIVMAVPLQLGALAADTATTCEVSGITSGRGDVSLAYYVDADTGYYTVDADTTKLEVPTGKDVTVVARPSYGYVVAGGYYKIDGDTTWHEITKFTSGIVNGTVYGTFTPSKDATVYVEFARVIIPDDTNRVVVSTPDNGKITVSPANASRGTVVTITATPDAGYELGSLRVLDEDGDAVTIYKVSDTKYTFVMPDGAVSVRGTFVLEEAIAFGDVSSSAYYYDAVVWAVSEGITTGTTPSTFSPNEPCTRAQIITFLWRAVGSPEPNSNEHPFTDVNSSAYYYKAMLWAVEQGITTGTTSTTFDPNATVTRAQTVTFLWRAAGSPAVGSGSFSDVPSDAYYARAVAWAIYEGITTGTSSTTFSPADSCTRAQIVTFLYRYLDD